MWYNDTMDKKTVFLAILAIIAIMNIVSFVLMGHDKKCARLKSQRDFKSGNSRTADGSNRRIEPQRRRQGKWRVPEKTLFLVTACFGGLGGVLGMKVFHHKTQHWYFKVFFPVLLIVQIFLLAVGTYLLVR